MQTENWLLKQARTNPDHVAIDDGTRRLTFRQVKNRAGQIAGQLDQLKIGSKVGLLSGNNLQAYLLAMAILASGRTIVWLNWRLSDEELARQIADSQLNLCLVSDELRRHSMDQRSMTFSQFQRILAEPAQLVPTFDSDQIASIMYTSGTTGQPKGVLQSFGNHFYSAISSALNLGLTKHDEWLCVAPIFHISGFSILMRSLIYGMTVRLVDKFRTPAVEEILVNEPVTIMSVVPFMLKKLLTHQQESHHHYQHAFRCMLLGGGTTERPVLEQCQKLGIPVVQCYGMTETCSQIVALSANDALTKLGSVGQPLFTTQLKLSQQNEVLLKTPALSPGYLNMKGKLASKMSDGWYRTGDVGHLDSDGYLYIDGRLDEMIISGGENIFPAEVEAVYQQFPTIDEIAVVGQADAEWGARPVAFVVSQHSLNSAKLIDYGRQHLAHYKVPVKFIAIDHLPKNASGKVQRYLLRQQLTN
ncbi:o-succinylbenzoate--CoA ligase [Limosilactobacillus difficilis]|uniref:o-succinylbenzoate--CoA ligase n=1 Tax=Limosilactobacillus difficilis TaxID=2991838 RepID=UPI0024BBC50A|nr:o-succinylbenzoate--CoA ligase [Limosilactobacillus difficilis]